MLSKSENEHLTDLLTEIIHKHKTGTPIGIYSVCSSHPYVLEAAMQQALNDDSLLLIESTSNQVDQFGGYTGMTPGDFVRYARDICERMHFPAERMVLGGDHLGPNVWQDQPAETAMRHAVDQVEAYIRAGYMKIHLDASMRCADDPSDRALETEVIAERAALLCEHSEAAAERISSKPVYIIGTEVPIPGGAQEALDVLKPTNVSDLKATIDITKMTFYKRNLQDAWKRVIAVVVQPGVEFGDDTVAEYDRNSARELTGFISGHNSLVFEAHSTDFQRQKSLQEMVEDHFAVLKVGPWLTFAMREAVFSLASIEQEMSSIRKGWTLSQIRPVLESVMQQHPGHWMKHYHGEKEAQAFARRYSYSDRIRYYWPMHEVHQALHRLIQNLSSYTIPGTLLSQYLPAQYWAVREKIIQASPEDLIRHKIREVLQMYASATGQTRSYAGSYS